MGRHQELILSCTVSFFSFLLLDKYLNYLLIFLLLLYSTFRPTPMVCNCCVDSYNGDYHNSIFYTLMKRDCCWHCGFSFFFPWGGWVWIGMVGIWPKSYKCLSYSSTTTEKKTKTKQKWIKKKRTNNKHEKWLFVPAWFWWFYAYSEYTKLFNSNTNSNNNNL